MYLKNLEIILKTAFFNTLRHSQCQLITVFLKVLETNHERFKRQEFK